MIRLVVVSALVACVSALDNGFVLPAMGTNTWNALRCNGINAKNLMAIADQMVDLGLTDLGYKYLNMDDCWALTTRDSTTNNLVPDPAAFPDGLKPVTDYIHSKGMKAGIYSDRGNYTCAGRAASGGHEELDAKFFADNGYDYLKEDSCHASGDHATAFAEYGRMRDALNATGRPILFSLCGWNAWYSPPDPSIGYKGGASLGNSWRIAGDCNKWPSVYNSIRINEALYPYAGPGGVNDGDMLVGSDPRSAVYNTQTQARTQFSLWSILASPLLIGSNLLNLNKTSWDIQTYSNTEVIAVSQDPLVKQGSVIQSNCPQMTLEELRSNEVVPACQQIWMRPLANGDAAVAFVNYDTSSAKVTCDAACMTKIGFKSAAVRDLWAHKDLGTFSTFTVTLDADGGSTMYKFTSA